MSKSTIQKMKRSMTIPVIAAPMFLISTPEMVIETCKAGVIGTFPALNARTGDDLADWMKQIKEDLASYERNNPKESVALWGINLIVHRSNKRYQEDLETIKKYEPPLVITSLGDPGPVVEIVHQYGGIVFSDVINTFFAKKAFEKGTDGLILVANGAGGHGGTLNPFAFINEVKSFFDGPLVLAGSLSKGEDVLAAEVLGADLSYVGSRFLAVDESSAQEDYKDMVIDSTIEDIIYTDAFSGINGNYLIPSIERAGLDPNQLESAKEINFDKTNKSDAKVWKDIWGAGQGVGMIKERETIREAIGKIQLEYEQAKKVL